MKKAYWLVLPWAAEHDGGVNQVVINLNHCLKEKGLNPSIFVESWEDVKFRKAQKNGINVIYRRLRSPLSGNPKGQLMYWLTLPAVLLHLAKFLREEKVVCVNLHYPTASALTFVILRKLGIFQGRLLISLHGLDFTAIASTQGMNRSIWHYILSNSDAIVACSKSLKKRVSSQFPDLPDHVKVIHNGFDPLAFEAERDPLASLPSELADTDFILNIGTYEHKKGQDVLLQAFHKIADSYPALKLALIGANGPVFEDLQQLAETLDIKGQVVFIKNLPHAKMAPFLEAAKFFVLPSRAESLPIAVLEAGAFALPIIASCVDGLPEIITSPDMGILVEPEDASGLADAMLKVLKYPEWAKTIGANLRENIHSNFNWHKATDSYLELLSPLLEKQN